MDGSRAGGYRGSERAPDRTPAARWDTPELADRWVVRHGDDVYVRSVNGPGGAWFRGLQARYAGHVSAGDVDADVLFEDADHGLDDEIDEEDRRKYGRSSTAVDRITSPDARSTTVRFVRT
jgi:hypothetical protein